MKLHPNMSNRQNFFRVPFTEPSTSLFLSRILGGSEAYIVPGNHCLYLLSLPQDI
jgi:hypothetical protein